MNRPSVRRILPCFAAFAAHAKPVRLGECRHGLSTPTDFDSTPFCIRLCFLFGERARSSPHTHQPSGPPCVMWTVRNTWAGRPGARTSHVAAPEARGAPSGKRHPRAEPRVARSGLAHAARLRSPMPVRGSLECKSCSAGAKLQPTVWASATVHLAYHDTVPGRVAAAASRSPVIFCTC